MFKVNSMFIGILFIGSIFTFNAQATTSIDTIVNEIQKLENQRDPKCYATASRLEDFMFGTPLSDGARFSKHQLQKEWAKKLWQHASQIARSNNSESISVSHLSSALAHHFNYQQDEKQHWEIAFPSDLALRINREDKRQYSTIAYSLRAILAVQQESLMDLESDLLPLQPESVQLLKNSLDLLSLSALKIADTKARKENQHEVDKKSLQEVWAALTTTEKTPQPKNMTSKIVTNDTADLSLVKKVINQKVASYAAYNKVSNELFVRNLQVYYARLSWPKDPKEGKAIRNLFTETMIQFAYDLYKDSERVALKNQHHMILESDVHELIQSFIPHDINIYEDAIFFPKLPSDQRITIESYDMDSFRDSGGHWQYLDYAIQSPGFVAQLQPDPFALELLVENIAQFGVLSLRAAGDIGKQTGAERLTTDFYIAGLKSIQKRITLHKTLESDSKRENTLVSSVQSGNASSAMQSESNQTKFSDVTANMGISAEHRSSDWLNRLLRSYLKKTEEVGIITIPPAFGGSGVAAEDINNDGFIDLLILSGVGNKLYLNQQGQSFKDITRESGLDWRRDIDNTYGEPRQPLIVDLNNDGLQDIVITYVNDLHRVYQNLGSAQFKDVTAEANLGGLDSVAGPATVADFDNDGLLDIYIGYFGHYTKGVLPTLKRRNTNGLPNQLFKNMGGFKFKNISQGSGTENVGWAQAIGHTDFNLDGKQDLIVGNDFGVNAYLQNNGDGTFINVSSTLGTEKPSYTMGIGIGDLNQDLYPDIYISNIVTMNKDEKYVLPNENTPMKFNANKLANMRVVEANDLFLSVKNPSGEASYELSDAVGRGYSSTGWSWDADFFDFDNDGDNDLYVLNGMNEFNLYSSENPYYEDPILNEKRNIYVPVATKESNVFFINEGGKLINHSKQSGVDLIGNSRSASYLDFDRDGDLDIALNNYHGASVLYRNNLAEKPSRWITLKLIGDPLKKVNRDAVGAKIILTTMSGQTIWREVHSTIGYLSVHPKTQHFGLGDETIKDIKITWPNGEQQSIHITEINQEYLIKQGEERASLSVDAQQGASN